MAALRCSMCGINWPPQRHSYAKCPACEETTGYLSDATPLDHDEAQKMKARFDAGRSPMHQNVTATRQKYADYWEAFEREYGRTHSGPPDADPRGAHHGTNRRWPELERLCALAEARKVHVHLRVTDRLVAKGEKEQRRGLYEIALVAAGQEISSEPVRSGDLDQSAETLIPILTAGFGQRESD